MVRSHALDGLRATAATLIVVFHLGLANLAIEQVRSGRPSLGHFLSGFGASGVELFFALSAVVLLRPYLRDGRQMDVGAYFRRRITRLWPPFLGAWLLAGCVVAMLDAHPNWWPSAMPGFSFGEWNSQAFIVYTGNKAYNFAWWTLSIEMTFYLLAPIVVLLLAKRPAALFVVSLVASAIAAQAASFVVPDDGLARLLMRFVTFSSCFMGGVVLAKFDVERPLRYALGLSGLAIVAASVIEPRVNGHIGYGLVYMALVSEALDLGTWCSRLLSTYPMVWLGERSYSLFLTHFSVIALACWSTAWLIHGKGFAFFVISRVLAIAGSLVVACLLFESVESRFAKGLMTAGQWLPRSRGVGGGAGRPAGVVALPKSAES
jgi:peptidoglycan/LPS O-acetylase OafA/YrhL